MKQPHRAIRLTLAMEADTLMELAFALEEVADRAERDELTAGTSGGVHSGYSYELLQNHEQTHDKYFQQLRDYLAAPKPEE